MQRLVGDNIHDILALMGQSGSTRTCVDDKEFFLLLKEKIIRDLERMFSEKEIRDKADALVDLYNDLDEFKSRLVDKVDWEKDSERRTNYTGGFTKRFILESITAGERTNMLDGAKLLDWGKKNNYPAMVLARDENDVPYKILGEGELAWQNWIDAYEHNPENLGELIFAVGKGNRYEKKT